VLFRAAVESLRRLWGEDFPALDSPFGTLRDAGLLPTPTGRAIPLLVTGNSRQDLPWIARHGDGWLMYPRDLAQQRVVTASWQQALLAAGAGPKPFAQSLYVDLVADAGTRPHPIHLGYRTGREFLVDHLSALREIGVNHVLINIKYGRRDPDAVLDELAEHVLPRFPTHPALIS
jgi:luciferase-type oxidoreductase